jgi:hypothetical protein
MKAELLLKHIAVPWVPTTTDFLEGGKSLSHAPTSVVRFSSIAQGFACYFHPKVELPTLGHFLGCAELMKETKVEELAERMRETRLVDLVHVLQHEQETPVVGKSAGSLHVFKIRDKEKQPQLIFLTGERAATPAQRWWHISSHQDNRWVALKPGCRVFYGLEDAA